MQVEWEGECRGGFLGWRGGEGVEILDGDGDGFAGLRERTAVMRGVACERTEGMR